MGGFRYGWELCSDCYHLRLLWLGLPVQVPRNHKLVSPHLWGDMKSWALVYAAHSCTSVKRRSPFSETLSRKTDRLGSSMLRKKICPSTMSCTHVSNRFICSPSRCSLRRLYCIRQWQTDLRIRFFEILLSLVPNKAMRKSKAHSKSYTFVRSLKNCG